MRIGVFGYENKKKIPIHVSKNTFTRHVDLLLTQKESQPHYGVIKYFSSFMYN